MTLPKIENFQRLIKAKNPESFILPGLVVLILSGVIIAGFLIPKKNKEKTSRDTSVYTVSNKVEVEKGKFIEVAPRVKQISPESLHASLAAKENIVLIHIYKDENWQEPHINGSTLIRDSEFNQAPFLDKEKNYVYVSTDGYDSAKTLSKILTYGFSYDKNVNLEGGTKAWKEKGYELSN